MSALETLQQRGIRRVGSPRSGFRLIAPGGRPPPRPVKERVRALRLPPAWKDVYVAPEPGAKLQAIGRDRAGRWQYRYHPEFARRRASAKYRRLLRFAGALPRIRAAVQRDMRRRGLGRERVLAAMVRILDACFMRPGSRAYARENRSYGLTTIRPRHATVTGDRVVFEYRGKSGQKQVRELCDARVARLVRKLLRVARRDLFEFEQDGEIVDVRRRHLNAYIREISGAPFTAKDFRTWAGTLLCASELARSLRGEMTARERKGATVAALKAVAAKLGNTPAVARSSYVSPAVLEGFARGRAIGTCLEDGEVLGSKPGLCAAEKALVAWLRAAERKPAAKLRLVAGSAGRLPAQVRPTGATAKPLRRAARRAER